MKEKTLSCLQIITMSVELTKKQKLVFLAAATFMPLGCLAIDLDSGNIQLYAELFSVLNIGLVITSIISIKQYFFPGDDNRMPFHVFNLIFGVLFYSISLPYLIVNKQYYEGYQELIPLDIIGKFFFSMTLSSISQWIVLLSFLINTLYIKKYNKDYYESGMGLAVHKAPEPTEIIVAEENTEPIEPTEVTAVNEDELYLSQEHASKTEVEDNTNSSSNE